MLPLRRSIERIRRALSDEAGSSALEFIVVGLILLVPLAYLVLTLGVVQGQTLGAESAARHVARTISTASDTDDAAGRADIVLRSIAAEYGMEVAETRLRVECRPEGTVCPAAGSTVIVTVSTTVSLPFVPPVLGLDRAARIAIEEHGSAKVSRYWTGS